MDAGSTTYTASVLHSSTGKFEVSEGPVAV